MRLACVLLGLESSELIECSSLEKRHFRIISFVFLLLILLILFSNVYFFWLSGLSYVEISMAAAVLTFVIFCTLRFLFLSVGIAIYQDITFKLAIFNTSNIIRIPLFIFFIFIFLIPFLTYFHHDEYTDTVERFKEKLLVEHEQQNDVIIASQLKQYEIKLKAEKYIIDSLHGVIEAGLAKDELVYCKVLLDDTRNKYVQDSIIYSSKHLALIQKYDDELKGYKDHLLNVDYPFMRFSLFMENGTKSWAIYVLTVFFFLLFPFYTYTLCSKKFSYLRVSNEKKKSFVSSNYIEMKLDCKRYLLSRFNYDYRHRPVYMDEPFNQVMIPSKYIEIIDTDLFEHFNAENDVK